ncbi:MAG: HD domain-containing protein [Streptosporangiales bacterium]|nr:HD domain-containing protein [Streptosporangiales bacterium]
MTRAAASPWGPLGTAQFILIVVTALLVAAAVAGTAASGFDRPDVALAFGVLIALGELTRMTMPGNRQTAPIAAAWALGYTLLLNVGHTTVGHSGLQVIAVTALGMAVGELPHIAVGRAPRLDALARRLITVAIVALAFRPAADDLRPVEERWMIVIVVMVLLVGFSWLVDAGIAAVIRAESTRVRIGVAFRDELRAQVPLGLAIGASGMMLALSAGVMGLVALLVFTGPLLVTQVAFRRYAGIRATYLQTVRALSRVTEVGGYVETGHSRRVSRLALAVGRELGMRESELLELEYAALMHDIGQLSLSDPIPGGATVLTPAEEQRRIAELGAEVIQTTGVLDGVAQIVRRQSDPYLGPEQEDAPPLGSRIIRVVNAFDDLVGGSSDQDRAASVTDRLRLDAAGEYDTRVIEALDKALRRGTPS